MTVNIKRWLAQRIGGIDSVRGCVIDQGADVVIHSWHGVIIHVHLVAQPLKAKAIKRIVQEATRVGIGVLFVVDARLLPANGAKVTVDEWLLALHALADERIYTYRVEADGPHLGQVHFEAMGGEERKVHYGPDVVFKRLPFYRTWVKLNALKGDWLVANFGADAFWKSTDNTVRHAYEQAQRHAQYRAWHDHYQQQTQSYNTAPVESRLVGLFAQLGLEQTASFDEVKTAFRKLARQYHPDVSALPKDEAEAQFRTLNEAYNAIKTAKGW